MSERVWSFTYLQKSGSTTQSKMATREENFCSEEASKESKCRDRVFS